MVVRFYRPAEPEDFGVFVHDFPEQVETWINLAVEKDNKEYIVAAEAYLVEQKRYPSDVAGERIRAYQGFLLARRDFHEGKPVFIEYSAGL